MRAVLHSAGERIEVICSHRRMAAILAEGTAGHLADSDGSAPDVRVTVEKTRAPFETNGWRVLTRDAWQRDGQVLVHNACSSGLDLMVTAKPPTLEIVARWRPPLTGRAAAAVLRARSRLLIRAVLLQYPALWWSQQRGRAPLHASVCGVGADGPIVLIAGPGGVGKSTLVNAELARGAQATCDNLCVSDGHSAWGLLEPRRVTASDADARAGRRGRRMPHGRREAPWLNRVAEQAPDMLLVLRRGDAASPTAHACQPADVARSLIAGTYMAGELRRYWALQATLALGTGVGEIHPPVEAVASMLSAELPCREVVLGELPGVPLSSLLTAGTSAEVRT